MTRDYIDRFPRSSAPFFIWASQLPPHKMRVNGRWSNPVPATRHLNVCSTAVRPAMSSPSYKEADISDKPQYVQAKRGVRGRR